IVKATSPINNVELTEVETAACAIAASTHTNRRTYPRRDLVAFILSPRVYGLNIFEPNRDRTGPSSGISGSFTILPLCFLADGTLRGR
ncbi:hypothetical protein WA026_021884, partial [Henosepilachna vigintioctopunctata]